RICGLVSPGRRFSSQVLGCSGSSSGDFLKGVPVGETIASQGRTTGPCSLAEVTSVRETERITDQALKMFGGGAWHGPSVMEALTDVDGNVAASHPIPGAHSIWELVLHLIATQAVLLRRMRGETAGLDAGEFWPVVPSVSESAWAETVARLKQQEIELWE